MESAIVPIVISIVITVGPSCPPSELLAATNLRYGSCCVLLLQTPNGEIVFENPGAISIHGHLQYQRCPPRVVAVRSGSPLQGSCWRRHLRPLERVGTIDRVAPHLRAEVVPASSSPGGKPWCWYWRCSRSVHCRIPVRVRSSPPADTPLPPRKAPNSALIASNEHAGRGCSTGLFARWTQ